MKHTNALRHTPEALRDVNVRLSNSADGAIALSHRFTAARRPKTASAKVVLSPAVHSCSHCFGGAVLSDRPGSAPRDQFDEVSF